MKAKCLGYINLLSFFPRSFKCLWDQQSLRKSRRGNTRDSHVLKYCLNSQEGDTQPHEIVRWQHFPPSDTQALKWNPLTIRHLVSSFSDALLTAGEPSGVTVPTNHSICLPRYWLGRADGDCLDGITLSGVVASQCELLCLLQMWVFKHANDGGHLRVKEAVTYSHWGPASMSAPMGLHRTAMVQPINKC